MRAEDLHRARPWAYHLTSSDNLEHLMELRTLFSARRIIEESTGGASSVGAKRPGLSRVTFRGREVVLRDQSPLHRGNTGLPDGFAFADFITLLNEHVFFWPGTATGPNAYGERHASRYADEDVVFLRVPTADLIASNARRARVCRYNSGSPRCSGGLPSPRGPDTFVPLASSALRPAAVVELVFFGEAALPPTTQWSESLRGVYSLLLS